MEHEDPLRGGKYDYYDYSDNFMDIFRSKFFKLYIF